MVYTTYIVVHIKKAAAMDIELEKEGEGAVYRQLADKIIRMIREERLLGGEKLPPERDLADRLSIARGTVKKAYELVEQAGLVRIVHGKGTFVLAEEEPAAGSRKDQAVRIIGEALNRLDALHFSLPEIGSMVQVMIMERERRLSSFHIAFVDCNPEALAIFEKQILYVSRMQIRKYLLDEVAAMENRDEAFSPFDLILTTTTHYEELAALLPGQKRKLLQAAVSPDRQTISELAAVPAGAAVQVFFRSDRFYRIIISWLREFGITEERVRKRAYSLREDGRGFDFAPAEGAEARPAGPEWIIIPPDLPLSAAAGARTEIEAHFSIIPFRYMIQRGSIIHIEERISRILDEGENRTWGVEE